MHWGFKIAFLMLVAWGASKNTAPIAIALGILLFIVWLIVLYETDARPAREKAAKRKAQIDEQMQFDLILEARREAEKTLHNEAVANYHRQQQDEATRREAALNSIRVDGGITNIAKDIVEELRRANP